MYFIYKITNLINGKIYIGQTHQSVNDRWAQHCYKSINNKDNIYFHNAIRKYGKDNFKIDIIDSAQTKDEINFLERKYIKILQATNREIGYNTSLGGDGEVLFDYELMNSLWDQGYSLGQIAQHIGCIPETVRNAVKNNPTYSSTEALRRGKFERPIKQFDSNRQYLKTYRSAAEAARELGCSDYTILKCIREEKYSALGYYWCPDNMELPNNIKIKNKRNKRGVHQYSLNDEYIRTFDTAANAAREVHPQSNINATASGILQACKGNRPTAFGYKWKYVEE